MTRGDEKKAARRPLANRLQAARRASKLGQEKLAHLLGISKTSLCRWEQADAAPNYEDVSRFAECCGYSSGVAKWIAFGGSAPTKTIACELRSVESEVALREASKAARKSRGAA